MRSTPETCEMEAVADSAMPRAPVPGSNGKRGLRMLSYIFRRVLMMIPTLAITSALDLRS